MSTTVDSDIKVTQDGDGENRTFPIDMLVNIVMTDENEPDKINVSYAACKSSIRNPTAQQQEKVYGFLLRILQTSLRGMTIPGGEQELAQIQENLESLAR